MMKNDIQLSIHDELDIYEELAKKITYLIMETMKQKNIVFSGQEFDMFLCYAMHYNWDCKVHGEFL